MAGIAVGLLTPLIDDALGIPFFYDLYTFLRNNIKQFS